MNKPTLNESFRNRVWLLLLVVGCSTLRAPSANAQQSTPPPLSAAARLHAEPAREQEESRERRRDELDVMINSIDMKLVLIPDGDYLMGSPGTERGRVRYVEGPQRRIWITEPFYLGVYEVTVGQFRQFVEDTDYRTEPERDGQGGWGWNRTRRVFEGRSPKYTWRNTGFLQTDAHPVVNVTWNDAVAFCRWLSEVEGDEYRLPTEAEWEYACRAGTTTAYYHGDHPAGLAHVGNVAGVTARTTLPGCTAKAARDDYVVTLPVGRFRDNEFGLYDMHGNVWEWCADWYDLGYYRRSPEENPAGAAYGSLRVTRGGSWSVGPRSSRSASRNAFGPGTRSHDLGFRVALGPAPSAHEEEDRTFDRERRRRPDAAGPLVPVNSQKTLADIVGVGFQGEAWTHPAGLLPSEFPELAYISGPSDADQAPKGEWRQPVVLRHQASSVVVHVNCYRRREVPAAPADKAPLTPFVPLMELNYQYEPIRFHDLRAATATTENRDLIAFRHGDILFKVDAADGSAKVRRRMAVATAEAIWDFQKVK